MRKGRVLLLLTNIVILTLMLCVGTISYGEINAGGANSLIIPNDSLVMQGKINQVEITPQDSRLTVKGNMDFNLYPLMTETEVLSQAEVCYSIPILGYTGSMTESSPGKYTTVLDETLEVNLNGMLGQTDTWQIKPLAYAISLNGKQNTETLTMPPFTFLSLGEQMEKTLKLAAVNRNVVDFVSGANIAQCIGGQRQYNNTVTIELKAQLMDTAGSPMADKTVSATINLPNRNYSETITLTTDDQGIINYTRTESAVITVIGGQRVALNTPAKIEGTAYVVAQFWWTDSNPGYDDPGPYDPTDPFDPRYPDTTPPGDALEENNGNGPDNNTNAADDPVNVCTGNVFSEYEDMAIPGTGIPLVFTRMYNSMTDYEGPLGYAWTHSYNIYLEDNGSKVYEHNGDGALRIFTRNAAGTYTPPVGNYSTFTKNTDGSYVVREKSGLVYQFNPAGQLKFIEDRNGNQLNMTYDGNKLITIANDSGRQIALQYDNSGRITCLTDHLGRQVQYSYDQNNNLTAVTDQSENTTTFSYNNLTYQHQLLSVTDPKGNQHRFTYDNLGRASGFNYDGGNKSIGFYYEPLLHQTTSVDSKGGITKYHYTRVGDMGVISEVEDANNRTQQFYWDNHLNMIKAVDQNSSQVLMSYDGMGNLTQITDSRGKVMTFTYEPVYSLCSSITEPTGRQQTYLYDSRGNLVSKSDPGGNTYSYCYDSRGNMTGLTDPRGNTTIFEYDIYGNLATVTDPMGGQTRMTYDLAGNCTSVTDAKGNVTSIALDVLNRPYRVTYPDGTTGVNSYNEISQLVAFTDTKGNQTRYLYDCLGHLDQVTDAMGGKTSYGYDTEGNLVSMTDANGSRTLYSYDKLNRLEQVYTPAGSLTKFQYDPVGNITARTDANGNTTRYYYENNKLSYVWYPDGTYLNFQYDDTGRRTSMYDWSGMTVYRYDQVGYLCQIDGPAINDTISYEYDAAGNRTKMIDQDGGVTTYEYDQLNRMTKITDPQGESTTYTYDPLSNIVNQAYPNNTQTSYLYDSLNRIVRLANEKTGGQEVISSFDYTYDAAGMCTSATMDNGNYTEYRYDSLYRLTAETLYDSGPGSRLRYQASYTYDPVGNRATMTKNASHLHYHGEKMGLPGTYTYTYSYDKDNKLLAVNTVKEGNTTIGTAQINGQKVSPKHYQAKEILVKFKSGTSQANIDKINLKYGAKIINKNTKLDVYRLAVTKGNNLEAMLDLYRQEADIEYAEPNYLVNALTVPNDTFFGQQWALQNTGQGGGTPNADIHATQAWDIGKGSSDIIIAIIDTGCDLTHPDLIGRFTAGYDYVNNDSDPSDDNGHGTFCAGIAAAATDNQLGIAGFGWGCRIMPVKVLDANGSGTEINLANGITYAVDSGAKVISLSLGGQQPSQTMAEALKYAYDRNVVVCAASGNDGVLGVNYPAAYGPLCIAVAATDRNDQRASFSSFGPEVDVAAPGVDILSTWKGGDFLTASGTSAATPFVAGLAGLLLSQDRTLTPDEVEWKIETACDDVNIATNPGSDNYLGNGRINAAYALASGSTPPPVEVTGTTTYEYDLNGNLIKKNSRSGNMTLATIYEYDSENRLTGIVAPDGTSSHYRYDGRGTRVQASENGITTNYLYDGCNVIIERDGAGVTQNYYNRGMVCNGVGNLISVYRHTAIPPYPLYYQYDGLGNVTSLIGQDGRVVQKYKYDAFGNSLSMPSSGTKTGWPENPYRFSTKEFNSVSCLSYFGARYYEPETGRFITSDIWPGNLFAPQSMNRYAYVENNPVNYTDPLGLWKGPGHADLTGRAMRDAGGFTDSEIQTAIDTNKYVDRLSNQGNDAAHNMPGYEHDADKIIQDEMDRAVEYKKSGNRQAAMESLGRGLHSVQDKYSHSVQGAGWPEHIIGNPDRPESHPQEYADAEDASRDYIRQFQERTRKTN